MRGTAARKPGKQDERKKSTTEIGSVSKRLATRVCAHLQEPPGSPSPRQPDRERACAVKHPYHVRPGQERGRGREMLIQARRFSGLRAGPARLGELLSYCVGMTHSSRPFSLGFLVAHSTHHVPSWPLPPAALSNCLLEAAVKCREGRCRFTVASPRPEPGAPTAVDPVSESRPGGE